MAGPWEQYQQQGNQAGAPWQTFAPQSGLPGPRVENLPPQPSALPTITVGGRTLTMQEYQAMPEAERDALRQGIARENPSASVYAGQGSLLDPFVQGVTAGWGDELRGVVQGARAALQGGDFWDTNNRVVAQSRVDLDQVRQENPWGSLAAEVGGMITPLAALGATNIGARALGVTGPNLLSRMAASGASGAALSAVNSAGVNGLDDPAQIATDAAIGGGIGFAIPGAGAGLGALGRNTLGRAANFFQGASDPAGRAREVVVDALRRDAQAGNVLSQADEAAATLNHQPLINVDRGGETTRALMRSAANQSPEARAAVDRVTSDRFAMQYDRARNFLARITNGAFDDLGYQDAIRQTANAVNDPRYTAAFQAPSAAVVWNDQLAGLLQSDAVQHAISQVGVRSSNRAALSGQVPIRNPFVQAQDGTWSIPTRQDGSQALPSLQFWDQVKRNLDGMIDSAQRGANPDRTLVSDLTALKSRLVSILDNQVPEYAAARQGAHSYFQADDALGAGRTFARTSRNVPEAGRAFNAMTPPEQEAFRIGYASELLDNIGSARFRANVIDQAFGSPAKREMFELVFGPARARQMEAFVRVEDIMDRARGALGNSTTARQLMEMGLTGAAGGGATYLGTGDLGTASAVAMMTMAGRRGLQAAGQSVNNRVLQNVAELLASNDPALMQQLVSRATMSPAYMEAIEAIQRQIGVTARGASYSLAQQG